MCFMYLLLVFITCIYYLSLREGMFYKILNAVTKSVCEFIILNARYPSCETCFNTSERNWVRLTSFMLYILRAIRKFLEYTKRYTLVLFLSTVRKRCSLISSISSMFYALKISSERYSMKDMKRNWYSLWYLTCFKILYALIKWKNLLLRLTSLMLYIFHTV